MRTVTLRPTHFTSHRESLPPRFRAQCDEASASIRIEFASRPQLFATRNAAQRTDTTYYDSATGPALQLLDGKLDYDMPADVWTRLKALPNIFYRISASVQAPPDWSAAPPRTITSINEEQAALGRANYIGISGDRLQTPWVFPDGEAIGGVPAYYRAKLTLLTQLTVGNENAYLLRRLAGQEAFTSLPLGQRVKALHVFAATDLPARRALLQLFSRQIPVSSPGGSAVAAVRSTDLSASRGTLLDNLVALADVAPHLDIPDTQGVLLAEAIEEVADPSFAIDQGTKGTCVPTSVSWMIATYFPAEYVRLATGLLSTTGRVTLANGDVATVPGDSYAFDPSEDGSAAAAVLRRSWSERMFQATMMGYSRPGMSYSNVLDVFADKQGGLTMTQLCRMLRGLRNRAHREANGAGSDLVAEIAARLARPTLPVFTQLRWSHGSHEVVSVQASGTDVTIRNPWGGARYRIGQVLTLPPRRIVNPSRGEEAIAVSDLSSAIQSIVIED